MGLEFDATVCAIIVPARRYLALWRFQINSASRQTLEPTFAWKLQTENTAFKTRHVARVVFFKTAYRVVFFKTAYRVV
jgi:hypothetical protein